MGPASRPATSKAASMTRQLRDGERSRDLDSGLTQLFRVDARSRIVVPASPEPNSPDLVDPLVVARGELRLPIETWPVQMKSEIGLGDDVEAIATGRDVPCNSSVVVVAHLRDADDWLVVLHGPRVERRGTSGGSGRTQDGDGDDSDQSRTSRAQCLGPRLSASSTTELLA